MSVEDPLRRSCRPTRATRSPSFAARACRVWDDAGRAYLDFAAGIASVPSGTRTPRGSRRCGPRPASSSTCRTSTRPAAGGLAGRLAELAGFGLAFFANSGAEANEAALKLARKHGRAGGAPGGGGPRGLVPRADVRDPGGDRAAGEARPLRPAARGVRPRPAQRRRGPRGRRGRADGGGAARAGPRRGRGRAAERRVPPGRPPGRDRRRRPAHPRRGPDGRRPVRRVVRVPGHGRRRARRVHPRQGSRATACRSARRSRARRSRSAPGSMPPRSAAGRWCARPPWPSST